MVMDLCFGRFIHPCDASLWPVEKERFVDPMMKTVQRERGVHLRCVADWPAVHQSCKNGFLVGSRHARPNGFLVTLSMGNWLIVCREMRSINRFKFVGKKIETKFLTSQFSRPRSRCLDRRLPPPATDVPGEL